MSDKYIIHFISKTKSNMDKFIEKQLKEEELFELVPSHGNILTVLYENNGKINMKDIAKKINKDKSTVTALVNKLINLGYIEKQKSEEDKRVTYIKVTKKAEDIYEKYSRICDNVKSAAYSDFTEEEKDEFLRLLKKLGDNIKKEL